MGFIPRYSRTIAALLLLTQLPPAVVRAEPAGQGSVRQCLTERLKRGMVIFQDFPKWRANQLERASHAWEKYQDEVGKSKLRLVIKDRDVTRPRNPLKNPGAYLSNPFATLFNRPREVTIPVQIFGLGLVSVSMALTTNSLNGQIAQSAQSLLPVVPGGKYLLGLASAGALDATTANELIIRHAEFMQTWGADRSGKILLPRLEDFRASGLLDEKDMEAFNQLCHRVFREALTRSHEASGDFTQDLVNGLSQALGETGSSWARKSGSEISLLTTAFWPRVKVGKDSDVELGRRIFAANLLPSEASRILADSSDLYEKTRQELQTASELYYGTPALDPKRGVPLLKGAMANERDAAQALAKAAALTAVRRDAEAMSAEAATADSRLTVLHQMLNQGLGIGDATAMAESTLKDGDEIRAKQARARSVLPDGRLATAGRVDIPTLSGPAVLELGPGGSPRPLRDELDRWELFLRDPRFAEAAALWKGYRMSDLEALHYVNTKIEALNQLAAIRQAEIRGPGGQNEAILLAAQGLGIQRGFTGSVNPFFHSLQQDLSRNLPAGASEAKITSCLLRVTDFWLAVDQEEAVWAKQSEADFQRERDQAQPARFDRYQSILADCRKR